MISLYMSLKGRFFGVKAYVGRKPYKAISMIHPLEVQGLLFSNPPMEPSGFRVDRV